jgi:hypothetical protein
MLDISVKHPYVKNNIKNVINCTRIAIIVFTRKKTKLVRKIAYIQVIKIDGRGARYLPKW